MQHHPNPFLPGTVDEQIDNLVHTEDLAPAGKMIQQLQEFYQQGDPPEQVRHSLDAIWSRLADRLSPENQTMASPSEISPLRMLPREESWASRANQQAAREQDEPEPLRVSGMITLPMRSMPRRISKRNPRRTIALGALAAILLLSIVSWALVLHLNGQGQSHLGSGPGTPVPTVASTPAPRSLRTQAQQLLSQFHQEVTTWGSTHTYWDAWTDKAYEQDNAYGQQGIGAVLDRVVSQAQSTADYQAAIAQIQNEFTNLHAMESDFTDQTPWNQVHRTDTGLLEHYKLTTGVVVVVSLLEQSMRVYQHGQIINAFQVTAGSYEVPSLPGSWQVIQRQENTTVMSAFPKGSPGYYPPTQIPYMLTYHAQGYTILDSWWRTSYGKGTNFPTRESSETSFSHVGNIGLSPASMTWLYAHVQMNTPVVIY